VFEYEERVTQKNQDAQDQKPREKIKGIKKKRDSGKKTLKGKKRALVTNEDTFVYILKSSVEVNRSYVGVTNCLQRRLRQHNGQLAGGARFTRGSRPWSFYAIFVVGNRHDALSIEWKIKHQKRKSDGPGISGKIAAACQFGTSVAKFSQICGPSPPPLVQA